MATSSYFSAYYGPDYWSLLRDGMEEVPTYAIQNGGMGMSEDVAQTGSEMRLTPAGVVGALGIGLSLGKGFGDAVGGYLTARDTASALNAQASVSEDNARLAQMGAEQAFKAGEYQMAMIGQKQAETKAKQKAAIAANGIAIGVGSAAEQTASTDISATQDKIIAQQNALMQAWGYRRQRMLSFARAEGMRKIASATRSAGLVNMAAGIAGTAVGGWAGYSAATLGGK